MIFYRPRESLDAHYYKQIEILLMGMDGNSKMYSYTVGSFNAEKAQEKVPPKLCIL